MLPDRRYQIFISSTYTDLRAEREGIIQTCLQMGHIPVGMEMFSAADEEQWIIIKRTIDISDFYCVICAHRYGSEIEGVSFTEKEYDYAVERGVPVCGFVINADAKWQADQMETETVKREKLAAFTKKVKLRPVSFWSSVDELKAQFSIALTKAFVIHQRPGWIRATDAVSAQAVEEMARISKENFELRTRIDQLVRDAQSYTSILEIIDTFSIEVLVYRVLQSESLGAETFKIQGRELFRIVAYAVSIGAPQSEIERAIESRFSSREQAVETRRVDMYPSVEALLREYILLKLVRVDVTVSRMERKGLSFHHMEIRRDRTYSLTEVGAAVVTACAA